MNNENYICRSQPETQEAAAEEEPSRAQHRGGGGPARGGAQQAVQRECAQGYAERVLCRNGS